MLPMIVLTICVFGLAMLALAIGVILRGRQLRGSCGGPKPIGPDGQPLTCGNCTCYTAEELARADGPHECCEGHPKSAGSYPRKPDASGQPQSCR